MSEINVPQNPFPGLRPFEQEQHPLFFGREEQVEALQRRLARNRFLTVVGPSGSGKSSLIRAGLIPKLYQAGSSDDWRVVVFRPGEDPLEHLSAALTGSGLEAIAQGLAQGRGLVEAAQEAGFGRQPQLLLLVDQFEEIFRFDQQSRDAHNKALAFVRLLLEASAQQDGVIYTVLTMRADFLGACTAFQGLPEAINNGQYLIPRMTRAQLQTAIERPVAVGQGEIAPELVAQVLQDMGDNPDQLPIMQHALMRTWDHWVALGRSGPVGLQQYRAIGGIKEALSQHAEEVYSALPDQDSARIAEQLFKCLTDKVENTRGVRRPTPLHEICAVTDVNREKVMAVVEHFRQPGRWFLTPPPEEPLHDDTIIDIAHESLMRVWQRLSVWMGEEAESSQQYVRLANTAALYQEGKAGLYQDPDLELALNWRERTKPTSVWAQRYDPTFERAITFLEHSRKERDFILATREEQQRRQLRRARRAAVLAGMASIVFLLFMLFTLNLFFEAEESERKALAQQTIAEKRKEEAEREREVAEQERQNAETQRQIAEQQQQLAEEERRNAETQRQYAVRQQKVAEQERRNAEAQQANAIRQREVAEQERQNAEIQRQIAIQEKEIAERERRRSERLLLLSIARSLSGEAVNIHQRQTQPETGALLGLQAYLFHTRNGGSPLDPDIFNALKLSGEALKTGRSQLLRGHEDEVRTAVYIQGRERLISAGDDGSIRLWEQAGGQTRQRILHDGRYGVRALAFSGADRMLLAGTATGYLVRLDLNDLDAPPAVYRDGNKASPFVISAVAMDGQRLFAAGLDGKLRLWRIDGHPDTPQVIYTGPGRLDALALDAQATVLAWGGEDGQVNIKRLPEPQRPLTPLLATKGSLKALAFGPQGKRLAAGYANGEVLLWDWRQPREEAISLAGHTSTITGIDFTGGGDRVATSSLDKTVRVWNVERPTDEPIILEHDHWLWNVRFSPDGTEVIAAGADKNIYRWTVKPEILAGDICPRVRRNLTVNEWQHFIGADIPYENTCAERTAEANVPE